MTTEPVTYPAPLSPDELDNRFDFHPATGGRGQVHAEITLLVKRLAVGLNELLPPGDNAKLAFDALADARMRANAAVACDTTGRYGG